MDSSSSNDRSGFAGAIKRFYEREGQQDFRWRKKGATPYEVLIAIIFLQRTGRKQVAKVFREFISQFPDVKTLAEANLAEVRFVMEPLGLHWRAENVHSLGTILLEKFGGIVPRDEVIFELPGVGPYIGKMVLCLAFDVRAAPVDANVGRVLNRVFGLGRSSAARFGRDRVVLRVAERCLPAKGCKEYNLGLVDFGQMICRARNPKCATCSLFKRCSYSCKAE